MFIVEGKWYKMENKLRFWEGVIFKQQTNRTNKYHNWENDFRANK